MRKRTLPQPATLLPQFEVTPNEPLRPAELPNKKLVRRKRIPGPAVQPVAQEQPHDLPFVVPKKRKNPPKPLTQPFDATHDQSSVENVEKVGRRRRRKNKLQLHPFKVASRFQKNDEQLREMALRHISYEIKMLRELAAGLQGEGVGPRTLRNALLESFLIHYRNLYDFFYPEFPAKRRLPHDISAADYLANSKRWRNSRPELDKKRVIENRERVNCLLAHLTLRRLKYNNRSWPDRNMAETMEGLIEEFLRELPRERRAWFRSVIAKTEQLKQTA
jgi:hypothetical protein